MIEDKYFVHLHNHTDIGSNVRMRDSSLTCEELITIPASWEQKAVAITDHEAICSHVEAINKLNELKKEGKIDKQFKLILGNEIYLNDRNETETDRYDKNKKCIFNHFILLAKDEIGYRQIRELSTIAWRDNYFVYKNMKRVPTYYDNVEEIIGDDKGHLIALSACLGSRLGELFKQTLEEEKTEDDIEDLKDIMAEHIEWCIKMFGQDDFYIELQPNQFEKQKLYNEMLIKIAKAYNLKIVVTTDTHYGLEKDFKLHEAFLKSKEGDEERNVADFYKDSHFFETKDIYKNIYYLDEEIIDEAIRNTSEIADKCSVGEKNDYGLFRSSKIPLTPLPNKKEWYKLDMNIINKYEYMKNMYNDEFEYHTYLLSLIFKGLSYRKLNDTLEHYYERINDELKEIYLLSVAMKQPIGAYLTTEKANLDVMWSISLIGVGRGSSVVDVINYLLEITDVDPLLIKKLGLDMPIWRFIFRSKYELPDIDTDNCSHLKNQVFAKTREYYRTFDSDVIRIVTFKKEKPKSAIKTACKGLGINNDISGLLSSLIPVERGVAWSISDCYYGNEKEHRKPIPEFIKIIDEYKDIGLLETALKINGLVTAVGTHASGVLMINDPIVNYSSIMRSPSGELCCSYDLHQIEQMG